MSPISDAREVARRHCRSMTCAGHDPLLRRLAVKIATSGGGDATMRTAETASDVVSTVLAMALGLQEAGYLS